MFLHCPNDPNARTSYDIGEEIDRLTDVNHQLSLKHTKNSKSENTIKIKTSQLQQSLSKGVLPNSSDESSQEDDFEDSHQEKFFPDLMELKSNAAFDVGSVILNIDKGKNIN